MPFSWRNHQERARPAQTALSGTFMPPPASAAPGTKRDCYALARNRRPAMTPRYSGNGKQRSIRPARICVNSTALPVNWIASDATVG
ncbi:hypothetical protein KCP73_19165 [Salmonella enterica subsp. enterica]|nr:hypothetical protein KCP73_19165 [Salmonella enterica subsp. enterica]